MDGEISNRAMWAFLCAVLALVLAVFAGLAAALGPRPLWYLAIALLFVAAGGWVVLEHEGAKLRRGR